jgi:flavodoxin
VALAVRVVQGRFACDRARLMRLPSRQGGLMQGFPMNVLVVFDTQYGNTEQVAHAIAGALDSISSVRLAKADEIPRLEGEGLDLLVVGGPTQRQRMSAPLTAMLEATPRGALKGVQVAAFDTRYRMSAWLSGSAARRIARQLRKLGGRLVIPAESFFMERDVPPQGHKRRHELERLEPGEVERAARWATEIARAIEVPL